MFPIIQPPQVAIVGVGAVVERPWVVAGQVVPRQVMCLSLGADHRVTDGRLGAQFLARVATGCWPRTHCEGEPWTVTNSCAGCCKLVTEVAPDVEAASVLPGIDFRDQFDFDSMDTLNFAIALHREFGVDVPERDYARLASLEKCAAYLYQAMP